MIPLAGTGAVAGNEGLFILKTGALAGANASAFGVITEVQPNGGSASVAVCAGGFAGAVKVKLGEDGSLGDLVGADADGAADVAATTVCAQLLEDGLADELVEAVIFLPFTPAV